MKLAKSLDRLGTETAFSVLAEAKKLEATGKPMIHLGLGQPDFKTPQHIVDAAKKALDDGHHGYVLSNGILECRQAVTRKIKKLYITEKNIPIIEKLDIKNEHPLTILTLSEIDKLFANNSTTHQGFVLETLKLEKKSIEDSFNSNLIIALDQVTDPQNIGAIMRSAKVFGAKSIITTKKHSPGETGSLAKAASGALEFIDFIEVTNLSSTLTTLSKKGFLVIGLDELGESNLNEVKIDSNQPKVLVMGSEGKGLRRLTKTKCDIMAFIENKADDNFSTLNVSVSAAISLYQLSSSN